MKHSHLTVQVNECKINTTFSPFFEKKIFKVGFFNEKFITNFFLKKVSFVQVVRYQPHPDLICGLRQKCQDQNNSAKKYFIYLQLKIHVL